MFLRRGPRFFLISIHAPREGGDVVYAVWGSGFCHFNPRPPRGGRRCGKREAFSISYDFNPRPPRGGRHGQNHAKKKQREISIHAPREGGDKSRNFLSISKVYFNPRPPRGGRP